MAEYIIIVALDDPRRLVELDQVLLTSGFDTTMEPQAAPAAAFVLPRGVFHTFIDVTAADVHNAVALHFHRLGLGGSILVLEKADAPYSWSGLDHYDPNLPQPTRP